MIDFSADLRAILEDVAGFGGDAVYTPAIGPAVITRMIRVAPDAVVDWGRVQAVMPSVILLASCADVAAPAVGETILFDGVTYEISAEPVRDTQRVRWRIQAVER